MSTHLGALVSGLFRGASRSTLVLFSLINNFYFLCLSHHIIFESKKLQFTETFEIEYGKILWYFYDIKYIFKGFLNFKYLEISNCTKNSKLFFCHILVVMFQCYTKFQIHIVLYMRDIKMRN
jgi:hypothetical protein